MKLTKDQERLLIEAGELMIGGVLVKAPQGKTGKVAAASDPTEEKEHTDDDV